MANTPDRAFDECERRRFREAAAMIPRIVREVMDEEDRAELDRLRIQVIKLQAEVDSLRAQPAWVTPDGWPTYGTGQTTSPPARYQVWYAGNAGEAT